jgi:hypothetical protein
MSLWSRLFGKKPAADAASPVDMPPAPEVPQEELNRALISLLRPQLDRLGLSSGMMPVTGPGFSGRSRGYVYGMACGVAGYMTHASDRMIATAETGFAYVWGPQHAVDAIVTLEEAQDGDRAIIAAIHRGSADVEALFAGRYGAEVMGLWLLNNGARDQAAVIPPHEDPPPVPAGASQGT